MPKASPLQSDFSGGEYNPLFFGRVDSDRYKVGLDTCKNYVPIIQGPVTRRPGSYYAGAANGGMVLLIPFQSSVTNSFILEVGAGYIRFWKNYAQVMSGMSPYSISNPFSSGDLPGLQWVQDNDVLYIAHPNYPPFILSYFADNSWVLTQPFNAKGPYLPAQNTSRPGNTGPLAPTSGACTFAITSSTGTYPTYSSVLETGSATFLASDQFRTIMLLQQSLWQPYQIVVVTNSQKVTISPVFDAIFGVTAAWVGDITAVRMGLWNSVDGYPSCVVFHEDRLVFSGMAAHPQRIDGSRTSDYENFTPVNPDSSVPDSASYSFTLNSNNLNQVEWLDSTEQAMIAGSLGGEWTLKGSVQGEALTPSNVSAKLTSYWGSAPIRPVRAGKSTIHVQRGGKKVREMMYRFEYAGFISTELTELAGHITAGSTVPGLPLGIKAMAYQQNPYAVIWAVRFDGQLIGATFDHDAQSLKTGWHRHQLGGTEDGINPPFIQSIAVIPSPDGTRDDLWMAVVRTVDGIKGVYIEYLSKFFEATDEQKDAHCLDFGAVYDQPVSVSAILRTNPAIVTATAHGFSSGDQVIFDQVEGITSINGLSFTITVIDADNFSLNGYDATGQPIQGASGQVRKKVTTISGLGYAEGTTLQVYADGALQPDQHVSSGTIILPEPAGTVHVGLSYQSDLRLLPIEAGSAGGTALGKTRRTQRVGMYLYRTLGLKFGFSFDALDDIDLTTSDQTTGVAPALYSGIASETTDSDYDFYNQFCIRQETALPGTILAIAPMQETQDRG